MPHQPWTLRPSEIAVRVAAGFVGLILLVIGSILGSTAGAATAEPFSMSPTSGPPGSPINVASIVACPPPPPAPAGRDYRPAFPGPYVDFFWNGGFLAELEADNETRMWSGTITVPAEAELGANELKAACGMYHFCAVNCPSGPFNPDIAFSYYEYAPQTFVVCAAGQASCDAPTTSTSTTSTSTTSTSTTSTSTSTPAPTTSTPGPSQSQATVSDFSVTPGEAVDVSGGGFAPNQPLVANLLSDPLRLGTTQ